MQKEKSFLKRMLICALAIIVVYIGIQIAITKKNGRALPLHIACSESRDSVRVDDLSVSIGDGSVVALESLTEIDGVIYATVSPVNAGTSTFQVSSKGGERIYYYDLLRVTESHVVISSGTGNFSNYKASLYNMLLLITAIAILLWTGAVLSYRKLRYSYCTIFYTGFGAWITFIDIMLIKSALGQRTMLTIYSILQRSATNFVYYTALPILIFSILLCISNVSLIRHEGKGVRRMLGIILSLAMLGGAAFIDLMDTAFASGSEFKIDLANTIINSVACIYTVLECFLLGSVICGTLSAIHSPKYDRDYVLILGCKVRPDGTLYPLLRSRVDRAIGFVRRQAEKTGKKAIFVPTGGQGSDETVSEAAAMQRYLIEQGIEPEQIMIEDKARNTRENMLFSKALIDERTENAKVAFATTNYHVLRSGIISRQAEVEADGMGSPTKWYYWPNAYIREMLGMMTYKKKTLVMLLAGIVIFSASIQFLF